MDGKRFLSYLVVGIVVLAAACNGATLDRLRQDGTIRIAYRRDAPPFSYQNADAKPAGIIVDLCEAVATRLSQQLGVPPLKVSYVPVTASDRFDAIQQDKADLLCEATTVTLSRRKNIDFSVDTFVDGASLLTTVSDLTSMKAMAGQKIGVLAGTTTEQVLRKTLDSGRNYRHCYAREYACGRVGDAGFWQIVSLFRRSHNTFGAAGEQ